MRLRPAIYLCAALAIPGAAFAQSTAPESTMPQTPSTDCSVATGCAPGTSGTQPNTAPDSTLEGGTSGSAGSSDGGASGTLGNTGSGSTLDPGDSSGSSGSGSGGAAGPLNNTIPD